MTTRKFALMLILSKSQHSHPLECFGVLLSAFIWTVRHCCTQPYPGEFGHLHRRADWQRTKKGDKNIVI